MRRALLLTVVLLLVQARRRAPGRGLGALKAAIAGRATASIRITRR